MDAASGRHAGFAELFAAHHFTAQDSENNRFIAMGERVHFDSLIDPRQSTRRRKSVCGGCY
jgi:hypothetical protein